MSSQRYCVEYKITDLETGEITTGIKYKRSNPLSEDTVDDFEFSKLFQAFKKFLGVNISRMSLELASFMIVHMEYENFFYKTQKELAKSLNVTQGLISRSLDELIKKDFCVRAKLESGVTAIIINPEYAYKGKNRSKAFAIFNKYFNLTRKKENNVKHNTVHLGLSNFENETLVKILTYLYSKFLQSTTLNITVDTIVKDIKLSKVTVINLLKSLANINYITRKYGKIELKVTLDELLNLLQSFNS